MVIFQIDQTEVKAETLPDLFSPKGLDAGTCLLLESLGENNDPQSILDWGCGWGAITLFVAKKYPKSKIIGLDSDIGAVKTSSQNVKLNNIDNAEVVLSYSFSELNKQKFDLILSNPPTHRGREVVEQMISESFSKLNSHGELRIVVEARLKPWVFKQMKSGFGNCKITKRSIKHVVLLSTK